MTSETERHVDELMNLTVAPPPIEETTDGLPDDPLTNSLVDDILRHDGDELLRTNDRGSAENNDKPRSKPHRVKDALQHFFGSWWHNKLARYSTVLIILTGLVALAVMPTSRYLVLNTIGVRSAASLTVLDDTTQLPLKNVTIELDDHRTKTNQDGVVKFHNLKLGSQSLTIRQAGFATISRTITLGYGSNPLGVFSLDAVGLQFRFKVSDFLTGKPIANAEISSGEANAKVDESGLLILTIAQDANAADEATIKASGFRTEKLHLDVGQKQSRSIIMVPDRKEIFISKQRGAYDLYKVDLDGKNREVLLAASGQEDANISVASSPAGDEAAIVSRRDNTRNQDGFPLQTLTLVDVDKTTVLTLDHSERIQIVDWIDHKLIYVKVKAGTSAGNQSRYQLMSYDYDTTSRLQLATANNFNDVISMQGVVYYAASNNFQNGVSQFVRINPDTTGKQILLDKTDVWNITRTSYDTLNLSALNAQYRFKIGDQLALKVADISENAAETKFYIDAVDGRHALWTDYRDGKGVLLAYDAASAKNITLATQAGLSYPVRWLNARTVIYRVATASETADYAISLDGGAARKITDLTNVSGFGRWNY